LVSRPERRGAAIGGKGKREKKKNGLRKGMDNIEGPPGKKKGGGGKRGPGAGGRKTSDMSISEKKVET